MKSQDKLKIPKLQKEKSGKNIKSNIKDIKKDNSKSKITEDQEEKQPSDQEKNIKNIERYIYITNYSDINSMKIINQLFQDINSLVLDYHQKMI